jgi:hypothetical protein
VTKGKKFNDIVCRTKALYGGDLESAVAIMRTVASRVQYRLQSSGTVFHNKESHIRQVLQVAVLKPFFFVADTAEK